MAANVHFMFCKQHIRGQGTFSSPLPPLLHGAFLKLLVSDMLDPHYRIW